jgi:RNA polymerase sigma-70 factor (ECF subfamily)
MTFPPDMDLAPGREGATGLRTRVPSSRPDGNTGSIRVATGAGRESVDGVLDEARHGDLGAFERLVEPLVPSLYRLAAAMVGRDEAADVAQDALISAWKQLHRLQQPERLESWLRSILMNRARNVLRTRRRRPSIPYDPALGHADLLRHEPFGALPSRWEVEAALSRLRPDERAVIVLHYMADLPLREVADALRLREGTVKSRLHAALRSLRNDLGEELSA